MTVVIMLHGNIMLPPNPCRLWFDKVVDTRYPANVLSGFEATAGATFFNLNQLQVGASIPLGSGVQSYAVNYHQLSVTQATYTLMPLPGSSSLAGIP